MKRERIFRVLENGTEVFRGTAYEIGKEYNISKNLYSYINSKNKVIGRYNIVSTNEYKKNGIVVDVHNNPIDEGKTKPTKKAGTKNGLDYLVDMLSKNNNTIFIGDIKQYVEPLKEMDIYITYRQSVYDKDSYVVERVTKRHATAAKYQTE